MANITFVLKEKEAGKATPIVCYIRYKGQRIKYYTSELIHPKHWEDRKQSKNYQRAKGSLTEAPELNRRLDEIERTVKNLYREYLNDHSNEIPTPDKFKQLLDAEFNRVTTVKREFIDFFQEIIDSSRNGTRLHPQTGKPISPNTVKTYVTALTHIQDFAEKTRRKITFESIDLDFYGDYTEYLIKTLKLATNSVGKDIQIIKMVLTEATERGLNHSLAYKGKRFTVVREKSDSIYLTEAEIKEIEELDLTNNSRLERVRDLFIIGCHTGLRYSDYSVLRPEHLQGDFIDITQVKTGDPVVIPVHSTVRRIVEKYQGQLPKPISNQKTNDYLKDVGKLASSLETAVTLEFTKGGLKVNERYQKWELLTTHTARRSFATNEYLAGTPTITIMAITGHRTERAFLRYIKLTPKEHAKLLQLHWKERAEHKKKEARRDAGQLKSI